MVRMALLVVLFLLLVIFWPAVYGISGYLGFGGLEASANSELLLFISLGVVGALTAILPSLTRRYMGCLLAGLSGYLVAVPIAFLISTFGCLVAPPWVAVIVLGSVPLLIFTFIGYQIGEKVHLHKKWSYH